MEEKENKIEEFKLEDILSEFSDHEGVGLPEENVVIWDGKTPTQSANPAFAEDTIRLDGVAKAAHTEVNSLEETVTFTPVNAPAEEEEHFTPPTPEAPKVEPFSDDWEPEYEQPIAEYVPPQPIIFRPRSRLQELKRKLVAGPEKRYYQLMEQGTVKLQLAVAANFVVFMLSAAVLFLYTSGVIGAGRVKFVIFSQLLFLLISAALGSYQLLAGLGDLFRGRFSLNSLLVFSLAACITDSVVCLMQLRVPGCAAFNLSMTMSLWGQLQSRNIEMGQTDTMRKATRLDGVVSVPNYMDGRPGYLMKEGHVEDFMDHYKERSTPETVQSVYAVIALLCAAGIGVAAGMLQGTEQGIQAFSATLLVAVPPSFFIAVTRPMAILERRLHKHGVVLCSWKGVKLLSKRGVFPLRDDDMFPAESVKLNGLKFYGKRSPDDIVSYAAALIEAGGGVLVPLFSGMREARAGFRYEAQDLHIYEGGIGAVVDGESVLAGSLSFMQNMGVDMPDGARVNQAVYVAVDGALCAVFAVSYGKSKNVAHALTTLCAYRGLTPVMLTRDFMLTESFLHAKFGVNTHRIAFPDHKTKEELLAITPDEVDAVPALTTHEGMLGAAYAVTGSRALRSATNVGVGVHLFGGILGILMMLVLILVHAEYLLTPTNILLYEIVWLVPALLVTEWTRTV